MFTWIILDSRHLFSQDASASTASNPARALLSELIANKIPADQAAALYASLYVRKADMFDRRQLFWVQTQGLDKAPPNLLPKPLASSELPANWQTPIASVKSTAIDAGQTMMLDLRWQKVKDRNLLGQRLNRSSTLIRSRHFLLEADVPEAVIPELVRECELTFSLLEKYFDLDQKTDPLWVRVVRNRAAYLKLLKRDVEQIGLTNGYYDTSTNNVFCYWDTQGRSIESLRHELTHQILVNQIGQLDAIDWDRQSDFWAFEAIATYMESMILRPGVDEVFCMVGGWETPRLQAARYRRLHDLSWIPFDDLRTMGREAYQDPKDIQLRYSQSAGLAHYFMDTSPELRNKYLKYIETVHQGDGDPSKLSIVSDESLRSGYDTFLLADRDSIALYPLQPPRRSIVLTHTDVRSSDLQSWPSSHRQLDWLDLSFAKIDGTWLSTKDPWKVKRWNLESTQIKDADIGVIALSDELTELDLSNCRVTDQAINGLVQLKSLNTIWLTGTDVTDAALDTLDPMKQLEYVEVQKSRVTQEAWRAFLKRHPKIRNRK